MFKKYSAYESKKSSKRHYWFTIVAGDHEVTSKPYTTAAMRDKGIEAVKKVVMTAVAKEAIVKGVRESYIRGLVSNASTVQFTGDRVKFPSLSDDTFNLENKKGKIEKR